MSLGLEIRFPKTELCPITEARVRDAYEAIEGDVLRSWRFFHAGNREQGRFDGAPSACFWAGKRCGKAKAIRPAVRGAIDSVLKATAADCQKGGLPPEPFMEEAAHMLKSLVESVCCDMIRIDRALRGEGDPKRIPPLPLDEARERLGTRQLEEYIDGQAKAISFLTAAGAKANSQTVMDRVEDDNEAETRRQMTTRNEPPPETEPEDCAHSHDFSSVVWYGTPFHFTATQASCVALLWVEWEKDPQAGLGLREKSIGEKIGSSNENYRLAHTFRKKGKPHSAWRTMIHAKGDGSFYLAKPAAIKKSKKKRKK